jgi:hypothetical protein
LLVLAKVFVALSALWAVVALAVQVFAARGGGRRDYSRRAGSPGQGVAYAFTVAMLPAYKETARLHPVEFGLGLVLHLGVLSALIGVGLLLAWPPAGGPYLSLMRPLAALALVAGVSLVLRRAASKNLRAMSAPDDYVATLATCGLLACAALFPIDAQSQLILLGYAGPFLVYLPLGKLRHAVFFFVARGNYGWRLGYRGVYPPAGARTE